jgi:hypothetical protein
MVGDLDCIVPYKGASFKYFRNDGTRTSPLLVEVVDGNSGQPGYGPFGMQMSAKGCAAPCGANGQGGTFDFSLSCHDFDGDGASPSDHMSAFWSERGDHGR